MTRDTDETARNVSSNVQAQKKNSRQRHYLLFIALEQRGKERGRGRSRGAHSNRREDQHRGGDERRRHYFIDFIFSSLSVSLLSRSLSPFLPLFLLSFQISREEAHCSRSTGKAVWRDARARSFLPPLVSFFSAKRPGRGEILWISSLPLSLSVANHEAEQHFCAAVSQILRFVPPRRRLAPERCVYFLARMHCKALVGCVEEREMRERWKCLSWERSGCAMQLNKYSLD